MRNFFPLFSVLELNLPRFIGHYAIRVKEILSLSSRVPGTDRFHNIFLLSPLRDVIGDSALVGDPRWAGSFGVSGDFIARDNCRYNKHTSEPFVFMLHAIYFLG